MTETQRNEKLTERGQLITQMRAFNDKIVAEKRKPTADEEAKYNEMSAAVDDIKALVDRDLAIEAADRSQREISDKSIRMPLNESAASKSPRATAEYKENYRIWMLHGRGTSEKVKASLTKATGTQVGYLVPTEYETTIRKNVYPLNVMRQIASTLTSSSDAVIPMEGSLPTFGWIDELGTYPQTDLTVGRASMSAWKLGGILKASEEVLADAFLDLPAYISDRSKVSIAAAEEAAFVAGDGVKKPTGVVTSASAGITSASPTAVTSDELLDLISSLSVAYRASARFLTTDKLVSLTRKLKDTTGQYIWQQSMQAGVPDLLFGYPISISPYMAVPAATAVSALFGNFSYYQILDREGFEMQQLNELYAESGQIGFKINERTDGKLLNTNAVVKLTQHA